MKLVHLERGHRGAPALVQVQGLARSRGPGPVPGLRTAGVVQSDFQCFNQQTKYVAHMKTMLEEMFVSNYYISVATQYQTLIDTAVLSDANKFFTYTQFQNGLSANATVGK